MRKRPLSLLATLGLGGILALTGVVATPALAASAANVDIRVELDLLYEGESIRSGPSVFEVTDVPIGDGAELTITNLAENPSHWCGSLKVDVDPVAKTITVSPDFRCDFSDVRVWVSSPEFTTMTFVSDDLLWPCDRDSEEEGPGCAFDENWCEASGDCDEEEYCEGEECEEYCEGEFCEEECQDCIAPVAFAGGGSGALLATSRIAPMAAPDSLAALTWSFAAPRLEAHWAVDQTDAGDGPRTENLIGSTVWSYAAAPTPPEKVDTAIAGDSGWAWIGAGALAAIGAIALGAQAARTRREA